MVKAYQRKTFDEFKQRYHSLDLLLIDDVQFFANKERTQEEFFNAFEALLARKSHIVMTSDTYPKGLPDIHERLVSRFDSGLTVAIEPPELGNAGGDSDQQGAFRAGRDAGEVAFFVAKNVRSNVLSWKVRCARSWRTRVSTRKRFPSRWRAKRCATC